MMNDALQIDNPAISVFDEAAQEYYDDFMKIDSHVRKRISFEMLDQIFKRMVIPAIDRVRELDRAGVEDNEQG